MGIQTVLILCEPRRCFPLFLVEVLLKGKEQSELLGLKTLSLHSCADQYLTDGLRWALCNSRVSLCPVNSGYLGLLGPPAKPPQLRMTVRLQLGSLFLHSVQEVSCGNYKILLISFPSLADRCPALLMFEV